MKTATGPLAAAIHGCANHRIGSHSEGGRAGRYATDAYAWAIVAAADEIEHIAPATLTRIWIGQDIGRAENGRRFGVLYNDQETALVREASRIRGCANHFVRSIRKGRARRREASHADAGIIVGSHDDESDVALAALAWIRAGRNIGRALNYGRRVVLDNHSEDASGRVTGGVRGGAVHDIGAFGEGRARGRNADHADTRTVVCHRDGEGHVALAALPGVDGRYQIRWAADRRRLGFVD